MPSVNAQENSTVLSVAGGSVIVSAVVRLYQAHGSSWDKIGLGAACLVSSPPSAFIKVVDLAQSQIIFQQEMYEGFDYQAPRPFFHTFEGDSAVMGLSFAEEGEAHEFFRQINHNKPSGPSAGPAPMMPVSSPPSHSTSMPAPASTSPPPNPKNPPQRKESMTKKKGFFSSFFKKDNNDFLPISEPRNFSHVASIGWSPDKGFEIRNIPPEWRKLFQAAGIKKGELKNAETAQYVMDVIQKNGGVDQISNEMKSAPPAPAPMAPPPAPAPPMAPMAPPPPSFHSAPMAPPAPQAPSSHGSSDTGRGGLLSQIQTGTSLRHVEAPQEAPVAAPKQVGMAGILAQAMDSRRMAIGGGEEDDDSDWSDEDWN